MCKDQLVGFVYTVLLEERERGRIRVGDQQRGRNKEKWEMKRSLHAAVFLMPNAALKSCLFISQIAHPDTTARNATFPVREFLQRPKRKKKTTTKKHTFSQSSSSQ